MIKHLLIPLTIFTFLSSCSPGEPTTEGAAPVQELANEGDTTAAKQPDPFPQTRQDTLLLEGMREPVELQLYRSPEGWPLQVATYLPPDIEAEEVSSGEGDALQFRMGEALLSFVLLPEGTNRSSAQVRAKANFGKANVQSCQSSWDWQWKCMYVSNLQGRTKRLLIGEQQGRQFYFFLDYPLEYGDGAAPRFDMVIRGWRFL
jgi:hypothetical protein